MQVSIKTPCMSINLKCVSRVLLYQKTIEGCSQVRYLLCMFYMVLVVDVIIDDTITQVW